ncbi:hypothetical protein [Dishui Lake large algae virus 1]|nr:hypothetical protein [Dishui Lake large algae virus 1]
MNMISYKRPNISLSELYDMKKKKEYCRTICFDYIIELCHRRIRNVASYGGMNCFYEIPGMLIGYPLYNLEECTHYVIDKLRGSGFLVQLLPPPHVSVVYVSWDPQELKPRRPALMGPSGSGKDRNISKSSSSIPMIGIDNHNSNNRTRGNTGEKMIVQDAKQKITNPLKDRFRIF